MDAEKVWEWTLVGAVIVAVLTVATLAIRSVSASGGVDFCVVQYSPPGYLVTAHKPWRADVELTRAHSIAEAVEAMAATHCPSGKP